MEWALKPSATIRAMASVDPPVANGATMVIGRFGQSCAFACRARAIRRRGGQSAQRFHRSQAFHAHLLVRPDAGGANDLRPFRHFRLEELGALLRRAADRLVAGAPRRSLMSGSATMAADHAVERSNDLPSAVPAGTATAVQLEPSTSG